MSTIQVVLATGDVVLNRALTSLPDITVIAEVQYREALMQPRLTRHKVDVVVVSTRLPGQESLPAALLPLRLAGVRAIVVGPPLPDAEVEELILIGVYDFLTGNQPLERIAAAIKNPWTLGEALAATGRRSADRGVRDRVLSLMRSFRTLQDGLPDQPQEGLGGASDQRSEQSAVQERKTRITPVNPIAQSAQRRRDPSNEEPLRLQRPGRPLVAVWSPTSAGATTVAAELAAALGRSGVAVGLLDLDIHTCGLGGRLCLPQGTNALSRALSARITDPVPEPIPVWPGVMVYADAPDRPRIVSTTGWHLDRLLAAGAPGADWWIVDLPREGDLADAILQVASAIVIVADPDWSRVALVRKVLHEPDRWPSDTPIFPVVNRWPEKVPGWPPTNPAEVFGQSPAAILPLDPVFYAVPITGRPAALLHEGVGKSVDALAFEVGRHLIRASVVG